MSMSVSIVKGGLTAKMILDDVFCQQQQQQQQQHLLLFNQTTTTMSSCTSTSVVVAHPHDDFFVDQLLNLNNNDDNTQLPFENQQQQQQQQQQCMESCGGSFMVVNSVQQVYQDSQDTSFLTPPLEAAEEADLEWLSHFVDDSTCPYSTPFPPGYVKPKPEPGPEQAEQVEENTIPLSLRERTRKRFGSGGRVWARSTAPKQATMKRERSCSGQQRRCTHCGEDKTPQWRQGPDGAKTLCNACGVRYKSGRLLPEYRPACSPTFSSELHSNSHRKVMEMRMKKENGPQVRLFRPVSSFS